MTIELRILLSRKLVEFGFNNNRSTCIYLCHYSHYQSQLWRPHSMMDPNSQNNVQNSEEMGSAGSVNLLPMDTVEGMEEFVTGEVVEHKEIKIKDEGWCKKFRWIPTSATLLENAEAKILSYVKVPYRGRFVDIGDVTRPSSCKMSWSSSAKSEQRKIWTVGFNEKQSLDKTPLVMVHGLCAAIGLWSLNIKELASDRTVYVFDLLGFGRSSRPTFSSDPQEAESQHVEAMEQWRKEMNLESFVLVGHSMGGFLSSAYALKYPERIAHLVLVDPWGYPKKPENPDELVSEKARNSWRYKAITTLGQKVNPLSIVRGAGPYGPSLISKARPDLVTKFDALNQNGSASISEYIYHCNAQKPTGEEAFRAMMDFFGWAKNAMYNRIDKLVPSLPLTMIYGDRTWLPQLSEEELKEILPKTKLEVHTLEEAGHHVYVDSLPRFNEIIKEIGKDADFEKMKQNGYAAAS